MELQWPLIIFTSLLAWSAGLFATLGYYIYKEKATQTRMLALIVSFVILAVGGVAVFLHLQHWERIFNGFGHITSGITHELIGCVLVGAMMVILFFYLRRGGKDATIPKWVSIVSIVVSILLVFSMGHSYLMPSRPVWDTIFQVLSLYGAAFGLGPATMAFLCTYKEDDSKEYHGQLVWIGEIVCAVVALAYIIAMVVVGSTAFTVVPYWFDPSSPTLDVAAVEEVSPFIGASLAMTIIVVLTAALGVAAAYMGKKKLDWKKWGAIAVCAVLVSTVCLRVLFYQLGTSVYPFF